MLARIAACAAVLSLWPICTPQSIAEGRLLLPEVVSSRPLTHTVTKTEAEKPAAPSESAARAPGAGLLQAPDANASTISQVASSTEPFGLSVEPVVAGEISTKWGGVEAQIKAESRVLARCRGGRAWCPGAARRFLAIIDDGRARNGRARIGVINREINLSIAPTADFVQWGVADRWSAPLETFTTRHGDCEDYAIAKYVALGAAGVSQQDIRLVVVRNNAAREHHVVVAVRLDGDWIILDNRWLALVPDREMWRATPLFELDGNGVHRFVVPAPAATAQRATSGAS